MTINAGVRSTTRLIMAARAADRKYLAAKLAAIEALDVAIERLGEEGKPTSHGLLFTLIHLRGGIAS